MLVFSIITDVSRKCGRLNLNLRNVLTSPELNSRMKAVVSDGIREDKSGWILNHISLGLKEDNMELRRIRLCQISTCGRSNNQKVTEGLDGVAAMSGMRWMVIWVLGRWEMTSGLV